MTQVAATSSEFPATKKGAFRLDDLKEAYSQFSGDPDDIEAKFFLGQALQYAGQADEATDQFAIFHQRLCQKHGSHHDVIQYYNDHIAALLAQSHGVDQKRIETVRAMIRVLEQIQTIALDKRKKSPTCLLS